MNISDSERIAGFLDSLPHPNPLLGKEKEFRPAKKIEDADLVVINTCGVRQMAEDRVYGIIHNLKTKKPKTKIILTGCLANRKDVQRRMQDNVDLFCEIKDFQEKIVGAGLVPDCIQQNNRQAQGLSLQQNYLRISPKYSDKKSAYVPIMTGCNNFCAYCVVPYARGRETSRPVKEIISEVDKLADKKYKEIILLGQNVNSYKYESGKINFPKLLNKLAGSYPEITFRFLTSHPKDFSDDLIKVIADNKNIYREIHIPFQAGSNKILRAMNRPYTKKKYLDLIKKIKKNIPKASFTTDVIVGFPGETEKDFQDSVDIFQKVIFNEAYINKYSPRPGTAAWKLGDPIALEEKKRREKILRKLVKPNTKYRKK